MKQTPQTASVKRRNAIKTQSYWDSLEAIILFRPKIGKKVQTDIHRHIGLLRGAVTTFEGYTSILEGFLQLESDENIKLSRYDILNIQMKCFICLHYINQGKTKF